MKLNSLIKLLLVLIFEFIMVHHMTKEDRLRAVGMAEAGRSCKAIARCFGRAPKTIRGLPWGSVGGGPQGIINRLVLSMTRRMAALLRARGAYTRYWLLISAVHAYLINVYFLDKVIIFSFKIALIAIKDYCRFLFKACRFFMPINFDSTINPSVLNEN